MHRRLAVVLLDRIGSGGGQMRLLMAFMSAAAILSRTAKRRGSDSALAIAATRSASNAASSPWSGVIDAPTWSFDYEFVPGMERVLGAVTDRSRGIVLGRTTYEMFEPSWSTRTVEDDPGAPFFNDTTKYVVSSTLDNADDWANSTLVKDDADTLRHDGVLRLAVSDRRGLAPLQSPPPALPRPPRAWLG